MRVVIIISKPICPEYPLQAFQRSIRWSDQSANATPHIIHWRTERGSNAGTCIHTCVCTPSPRGCAESDWLGPGWRWSLR